MLMLQRDQAWRGLQTGGVWKRKVDTYINNTNFPLINMQQLKHIFQNLLNKPRMSIDDFLHLCIYRKVYFAWKINKIISINPIISQIFG